MDKLIGLLGILAILGFCVLFSADRKRINWRLVCTGLIVQLVLAFLILKCQPVSYGFEMAGNGIQKLLDSAKEGAAFIVGDELAKGKFIFAIVIGASIIFVGSLTSLAYHFGIVQWVVRRLGFLLQRSMGVSGAEGLSAAAEVFLGQVESQLLISRYISKLTKSELHSVMATAMATVSGSALVAYIALGMNPTYLLMASILTAPAALVVSKILLPELEPEKVQASVDLVEQPTSENFVDAIADGASQGAKVAMNVMVQLVAFIALVALVNTLMGGALGVFGITWTIKDIFGVVLTPVAFLLGVPWGESFEVGKLLATKVMLNEYIAYVDLKGLMVGTNPLCARTQMIATVALCGFANLGSIGINIGGLATMAPERKGEIARMGVKAMISATIACWMTGAIAGLFM